MDDSSISAVSESAASVMTARLMVPGWRSGDVQPSAHALGIRQADGGEASGKDSTRTSGFETKPRQIAGCDHADGVASPRAIRLSDSHVSASKSSVRSASRTSRQMMRSVVMKPG
jgi:hypothetical protein